MTMLITSAAVFGLAASTPNAAEILQAIDRLSAVGNVLYVAAHPDDENTELLSWLVSEKKLRAAYLSMTRGEGGQNLLGPERAPLLGVIRTEELLAARRIDGAEQFFGRVRDFGFSKTPEETLRVWGKDTALSDAVWVIRKFQPDVIITRFSPLSAKTHGHHTASAMMALEAFRAAADPKAFPEQLAFVAPWQAKRIVWNKGVFGGAKPGELADFLPLEIGTYNRVLGVSGGEVAAQSRSMHKSQGFGDSPDYAARNEYFKLLDGAPMRASPLDDLDFSWARVTGSEKFRTALAALRAEFKPDHPEASLHRLFEARALLTAMPDNAFKAGKLQELEHLIAAVAGVVVTAQSKAPTSMPGGEVALTLTAVQRSLPSLLLKEVNVAGETFTLGTTLKTSQESSVEKKMTLGKEALLSNPYWLREPPSDGAFVVNDASLRGLPAQPPLAATFVFALGENTFRVAAPIGYLWTDPVAGERHRPLEVLPEVTVTVPAKVAMFPDAHARHLRFVLRASVGAATGTVAVEAPAGFSVEPKAAAFALKAAGDETSVSFVVTPPAKLSADDDSQSGVLRLNINGPAHGVLRIDYPHIAIQTLAPPSEVKLVRFAQKRAVTRIGYINGAGDDVAQALRDVGYEVTLLDDQALAQNLDAYQAIVIGVRAFNVNPRMTEHAARLAEYVHNGGTVLAQYNTQNRISEVKGAIGPYPITLGQDRVTEEDAEVTLQDHAALHTPNKITARDFSGWVQERGLYFAAKWDDHYQAPLSMHDKGEDAKRGSLLIAPYGKGVFVYTGLAFFRQLPDGVPGAYRLFANLLARGH